MDGLLGIRVSGDNRSELGMDGISISAEDIGN